MNSTLVVILSLVFLPTMIGIIVWLFSKRMAIWVNFILSLTTFIARSSIIYYTNPLAPELNKVNYETYAAIRDSFIWLMAYATFSAFALAVSEILLPYIHSHFMIVRTPPGMPDKVVSISEQERKRA